MKSADFKVLAYENISEFEVAVSPKLYLEEALHNLILGLIEHIKSGSRTYDKPENRPLLIAVFSKDSLLGAALQTPPHNLVLSLMPQESICLLAERLYRQGYRFPGVIGSASDAFAETWGRLAAITPRLVMEQGIYKLLRVTFPDSVAGHMRVATLEDLELILDWHYAFARDCHLDEPRDRVEVAEALSARIDKYVLWIRDGVAVSMAAVTRETRHASTIAMVYTPERLRGNGYATALTAQLSQRELERGKQFLTLYTDLSNPTSNSIYQKIGYERIGDSRLWSFR